MGGSGRGVGVEKIFQVLSPRSSGSRSRSRHVSERTNVLIGQGCLHGG